MADSLENIAQLHFPVGIYQFWHSQISDCLNPRWESLKRINKYLPGNNWWQISKRTEGCISLIKEYQCFPKILLTYIYYPYMYNMLYSKKNILVSFILLSFPHFFSYNLWRALTGKIYNIIHLVFFYFFYFIIILTIQHYGQNVYLYMLSLFNQ